MSSFRIKIALLAGIISGVLLIGVGWFLWNRTYEANLDQVDRELRNLGHANLERRHGHNRYIQLDQALNFITATNSEYILHFETDIGRATHTSTNWPTSLGVDSFARLTNYPPGVEQLLVDLPLIRPRGKQDPGGRPVLPLKIPRYETRAADGRSWRVAVMGNPYQQLILGVDIARFEVGMKELRASYLALIPVTLLLVGIGSWLVAGRALRPVDGLSGSVENITARGLDQRIAVGAHDREFGRLITVFNQMIDRLEKSFHQATRFSADASHELKTPLTIMQGELEQALSHAPDGSTEQQLCSQQLEQVHRLKAITRKLLLLAHADAGTLSCREEKVDLSALTAEMVADAECLAPELHLRAVLAPEVRVEADLTLLQQAIQNLLNNAIKYNQPGGSVELKLSRRAETAELLVTNTGPKIEADVAERIFERFYRRQQADQAEVEGIGLGLSLAREIVRAHGGELDLVPSNGGQNVFRVRLSCTE